MTLAAFLAPNKVPFFFADVLTSAKNRDATPPELPTRAYIAPESYRQMAFQPSGYIRKIVKIAAKLAVVCAGDSQNCEQLLDRLKNWFITLEVSQAELEAFVSKYYSGEAHGLSAIILGLLDKRYALYAIGDRIVGRTESHGKYVAIGSGKSSFDSYVQSLAQLPDAHLEVDGDPLSKVLGLASGFMGQEITTGATFAANFGGAFEIAYAGERGFEFVDDIMHTFVEVVVDRNGGINDMYRHPAVIRQWYQEDCLYLFSYLTREGEAQRLEPKGYVVADLLTTDCPAPRASDDLPLKPNVLCIHHLFRLGRVNVPKILPVRGKSIDDLFDFSKHDPYLRIKMHDRYISELSTVAHQLIEQYGRGESA